MKKSNAQSAIEFMLLVGAVLFFIIVLVGFFQTNVSKKSIEKRELEITELFLSVQNEINLAAKSSDGYHREFVLPKTVVGKEYSIGIYDSWLYLNTTDGRHAMALPTHNVIGQLKVGETNTIKKINSTIFVN